MDPTLMKNYIDPRFALVACIVGLIIIGILRVLEK